MKFFLVALAALVTLVTPALPQSIILTIEAWNEVVDQTNFEVAGHCSGTLIDLENRLVLTAHHCVDGSITVEEKEDENDDGDIEKHKVRKLETLQVAQYAYDSFKRIRSVSYEADIAAYSEELDLAVVKIASEIPNTFASPVAKKDPIRGTKVKVVGNPAMEYGSIVDSAISSVRRQISTNKKRDALQLPGVFFGNSGGAIYNEHGEIVGVAHAKRGGTDLLGYAIPASSINKFLADNCSKLQRC
jgi:S1-C subfamily serine protease